jgi:catechol 2,3-dioxygenase-like lactoylglutathione lyase family enzyme
MDLGNFSVSLTVKDLAASRAFYEKLGFTVYFDQAEAGWLILRNRTATIGLFQGMFERNILTFNPGWDADAHPLSDFTDVRDLERTLAERGIAFQTRTEPGSSGPGSVLIIDPDGNPILLDQHV